jgi:uncharacterized damage-inducible protein DinB
MRETELIADLMKRTFAGGAWYGPSLMEALEGVTAEQAAARRIENAHTIWEIVVHLTGWKRVVRCRLAGESILPTAEEDWPRVESTTREAWLATLEALKQAHAELERAVFAAADARLPERVEAKDYDVRTMLYGLGQHDVYHAGQVSLLKKFA